MPIIVSISSDGLTILKNQKLYYLYWTSVQFPKIAPAILEILLRYYQKKTSALTFQIICFSTLSSTQYFEFMFFNHPPIPLLSSPPSFSLPLFISPSSSSALALLLLNVIMEETSGHADNTSQNDKQVNKNGEIGTAEQKDRQKKMIKKKKQDKPGFLWTSR